MSNPFSVFDAAKTVANRDSDVAAAIEANDRAETGERKPPAVGRTPSGVSYEQAKKTERTEDGVRSYGAPMQGPARPEVTPANRKAAIEAAQAEQVERLNAASQRRAQSTDDAN